MVCSVHGCEQPTLARGWCGMHYKRWKKNGDPLVKSSKIRKTPAEYQKKRRELHPESVAEAAKRYRLRNSEKVAAWNRHRRALRQSVESEFYTVDMILGVYGNVCHLCQSEIDLQAPRRAADGPGWETGLHLDHVTPISKGGSDLIENIRPSHAKCNLLKGATAT